MAATIERMLAVGFRPMHMRHSLFMACIVCCFSVPRAAHVCEAADDQPTIDALAALIDDWQATAAFKCHFRRRLVRCPTLDAALSGRGVEMADEAFPTGAEGWFYKLGAKARLGVDYHAPPRQLGAIDVPGVDPNTAAKAVTNVSFDEVGNGRFEIRFEPKRGNFGDAAWIAVTPANRRTIAAPGQRSAAWINPLAALNSDSPNPLRFYEPGNTNALAPDTGVLREIGPDRLEVTVTKHLASLRAIESRSVVLWTKPSLPVVERIDSTIELPDGRRLEGRVALSEFRDCAGAMVARVVRHAVPAGARDGSAMYTLIEWRSDDLGDNVPTDGDFVINLGQDTTVIGFAKPVQRGDIQKLDIDDITLADLDTTGGGRPPRGAPVSSAARPRWGGIALLLVVLNLMFGAALIWLWVRLRKWRSE